MSDNGTVEPEVSCDCHAHVFTCDLPMVPDARYRPRDDAHLETYLALLDRNGLRRGVLVQPSFLGTDNTFLLAALARHPDRLRGVAVVGTTATDEELAGLRSAGVRGLRFNLLGRAAPDFRAPPLQALIRRAAGAGLHLELHTEGPAWLDVLPALLDAGVTLVIDHFGRPSSIKTVEDPGFAKVLAAAGRPNVWVKLSAPYRFPADAAAAARLLLETAGPERLLWGSDWPWTQHPEVTDYSALKESLARWLGDARVLDAVLGRNPARLYWRDVPYPPPAARP